MQGQKQEFGTLNSDFVRNGDVRMQFSLRELLEQSWARKQRPLSLLALDLPKYVRFHFRLPPGSWFTSVWDPNSLWQLDPINLCMTTLALLDLGVESF